MVAPHGRLQGAHASTLHAAVLNEPESVPFVQVRVSASAAHAPPHGTDAAE
jgi:hypothetical protein